MRSRVFLAFGVATAASVFLAVSALGAVSVDGTLDPDYGSAITVQTINSGFGDSTVGDGTSSGGSELDAGYGIFQGGNLYLFLSGNFEANGNHLNIFISDGRAGQSTLAVPTTATMKAMNGSKFSPGFQATMALDLNDFSGTEYVEEYNLTGTPSGGFAGSFALSGGIGTGSPGGSIMYGFNNRNAAGVNGTGGTAADAAAAQAVMTGLEVVIPLSLLGNPSGNVSVLADINGGGDTFLSNQFLSGLPVGTSNLGNAGIFDFSSTPGEFFVVPEPSTLSLIGLGLGGLWYARRRRA